LVILFDTDNELLGRLERETNFAAAPATPVVRHPAYVPELLLWGLIVILATWPMLSLASAIETLR